MVHILLVCSGGLQVLHVADLMMCDMVYTCQMASQQLHGLQVGYVTSW